jgi:hypothetical protein
MVDPPRCLIDGEWLVLEPLARRVPVIGPLLEMILAVIERGPGELLHHDMERGMLLGIKASVEATGPISQMSAGSAA